MNNVIHTNYQKIQLLNEQFVSVNLKTNGKIKSKLFLENTNQIYF